MTGTTDYDYDLSGNLTSTIDADGRTTTRTYDALNRVLTSDWSCNGDPETVSWTYDDATIGSNGLGRLAAMIDPSGSAEFTYERRGMLATELRTIGGSSYGTSYQYDADGNRTKLGDLAYVYDYAGRPVAVARGMMTPLINSASYLPFGPEKDLSYANGLVHSKTYDARYRVEQSRVGTSTSSGALMETGYEYDAVGNITAIHDVLDPTYDRNFSYDDLSRLTTANTGASLWGAGSYAYDAMGNLLSAMIGARNVTLTYAGTTPLIATATEQGNSIGMLYDGAGNELNGAYYTAGSGGQRTYSCRNLLAEVNAGQPPAPPCEKEPCEPPPMGQVTRARYLYDGRGVRVHANKTISGSPQPEWDYLYTPELQLRLRLEPGAGNFDEFVWFNGRPVAQISTVSPEVRYTFTDHLGTPLLQTDAGNCGPACNYTILWRAEYEPYGNVHTLRAGTSDEQPLRLPGQDAAWSSASGVDENYNIFRWYRTGWGRYTQADPIGLKGGMNLFAYAGGTPTNGIDPLGLKCCVKSWKAKLTPASWIDMGSYKVKTAGVKSVICAQVCDDSKDCQFSQQHAFKGFTPEEGWFDDGWAENEKDTPGAFSVEHPSKAEICMTDQSVGMIFTNTSTFPMVSIGTTTATVSDKTGECSAVSLKWSHVVICNGMDDCKIKGSFP